LSFSEFILFYIIFYIFLFLITVNDSCYQGFGYLDRDGLSSAQPESSPEDVLASFDAVSFHTGDPTMPGLLFFFYLKRNIFEFRSFPFRMFFLCTIFKNIQLKQVSLWLLALKLLNWLRMKYLNPCIDQIVKMQFLLTLEISQRLVCCSFLFKNKCFEFRSSFPFWMFFLFI
jgi:hypothetical protein